MKICILTPRFPYPENGGDVLRINHVAQYLKEEGHTLCLVSYTEDENPDIESAKELYDSVYTIKFNKLRAYWNTLRNLFLGKPLQCGYYTSRKYEKGLKKAVKKEKPDMFLAHLLRMTPYLSKLKVEDRSIVEMTDALSKTYMTSEDAQCNAHMRFIYKIERSRIKQYEAEVVARFPRIVLVSQQDIQYLKTFCHKGISSLQYHTNGVDCKEYPTKPYNPKKICFIGNMRTLQNQDAVLRFIQDVFPLIQHSIPDAKFHIVGAQVPLSIQRMASDNVIITGYVKDLQAEIEDSCVAVAPVYVAAGIQNKVLTAMSCGLPIVLTSLISNAIPELKDKENCRIEDEPKGIANAIIEIIKNPKERERLSIAGYEIAKSQYCWHKKLENYIN